jgi:hypothetical protein
MSRIALALVFLSLVVGPASAQENSSIAPACPAGNLLAKKAPVQWQEIRRELPLLTDEIVAPEGAVWDASLAAILDTGASILTWDLGVLTLVRSMAIQADANDTYTVWGSTDGKEFKVLGQIDPATGHGLRTRVVNIGSMAVRFLRVGEGVGDGFYSISEVTAYCQVPTPFPPQLKVVDAPVAPPGPKTYLDYWNNDVAARWELILAMLGAMLLWYERRSAVAGMEKLRQRTRKIIFSTMGVVAFLTFFNFGFWHFPNFVHGWDTFHYYIGSKYFKELHYERLYECVATADSEEPGLRRRVELRKMTNLRTNEVVTTADILAHPERCKSHFTPERWQSFRHDLRYFRTLENPRRWDDSQTDHGFNATPVWNILGSVLSNLAPASKFHVYVLDAIDVVLITIMACLLWWSFGWRTTSIALVVFATNFPSRWYWIGGSFLRWDWLFWMGVALCLAKRNKHMWAGATLGYAAMLRIFPGFLFVAPLLAGVYQFVRTRTVERWIRQLFLGAVLSGAVLVPTSFVLSGGPSIYSEFVRNTIKHSETPLTNYMGLRTILNFRPSETGSRMNTAGLVDPWVRWKEARLRAFREAFPLYVAMVIAYLVLIHFAIQGLEPWAILALSSTLILFGSELTCYYYAFLIIPTLLFAKIPRAGEWMMWMTALTQFIGWAPLKGFPQWVKNLMPSTMRDSPFVRNFGMPTGLDEQYTWMSLATLVVFVLMAWELYITRKAAPAAVEAVGGAVSEPLPKAETEPEAPPESSRTPSSRQVQRPRSVEKARTKKKRRR